MEDNLCFCFDTFFGFRYRVTKPNQYLAITGAGFGNSLGIHKSYWQKPFQKVTYIDVSSRNFEFELHAMSIEKLDFLLPAVFTIGPNINVDDHEFTMKELKKYAILINSTAQQPNNNINSLDHLIKGILEGETRFVSASMTIEDIFKNRAEFKQNIVEKVQIELHQFGLKVFNANIKELQDVPGSEYFTYMRQKTKEGANNQAKIDVAEAQMKGTSGQKDREGTTRKNVVDIEAKTIIFENEKKQDMMTSNTTLKIANIDFEKRVAMAELEKQKAVENKNYELSTEVEKTRQKQNVEKLRAEKMSNAQVEFEITTKLAEATKSKLKIEAEGLAEKIKTEAEANLHAKKLEAQGIQAVYEAEANGVQRLMSSFGNDSSSALSYLMIDKGVYSKLAEQNAKAIQGLAPKISVWNTGNSSNTDPLSTVRNIFQVLPPMLDTIKDQTGIKPPNWMVQLPEDSTKENDKSS